ncbi:universal stress protein [Polaromonas sp.]|uniref:universal stress protein n=1 Tax=Polaromonas sp. TaxID=1869339 RepID=UPI00179509CA|nr:universal stress protein [Polaromonas sp.]NML86637.1 universal stress protein [Polaromonas sp.]
MYKRILLAYDGSEAGQKALLDCRDIAHWSQSAIFLGAVMSMSVGVMGIEGGYYSSEMIDQEKDRYQTTLNDGLRRLAEAGYQARGEVLVGEVVPEITRYAGTMQADLIVVGHKHLDNWAARWWRGSMSSTLIEHSPCSVLVVITR